MWRRRGRLKHVIMCWVGARPRAPLQHSVVLQSFPMNHRIVAIAVTAAFASGLVVGHYAGPRDLKVSRQGVERTNKPIARASTAPSNLDIPQASSVEVSASSSAESIIGAIQNAAAHPANGQLYAQLSKLVSKLDPGKDHLSSTRSKPCPIGENEIRLCRC